jgi:hypothetical protein
MKNKWENYCLKDGKVQNSYIREYSSLSPKKQIHKDYYGKTNSRTDEKKEPEDSPRRGVAECSLPGEQLDSNGQAGSATSSVQTVENTTRNVRGENESIGKEISVKTHQQGQQGIQEPAEGRPEAQEGDLETQNIQREEEVNGKEGSDRKGQRRARSRSKKSS